MQTYDIIVLVILIAGVVWGARRGFARQLATMGSLILGYLVAVKFREPMAELIELAHPWNLFTAMAVLFAGTSLAVWILFAMVKSGIEDKGLGNFDTQLGGLLGLAKAFVLVMVITLVSVVMVNETQRHAILDSYSGHHLCLLINRATGVVPTEWQQALQPYVDTYDEHQYQHALDSPTIDAFPDPFENASPSDSLSPYDDPLFGSIPIDGVLPPRTRPEPVVPERVVPEPVVADAYFPVEDVASGDRPFSANRGAQRNRFDEADAARDERVPQQSSLFRTQR